MTTRTINPGARNALVGEDPDQLGSLERGLSIVGGSVLSTIGLDSLLRFTGGAVLFCVGGYLMYRGASGHCPLSASLGKDRCDIERNGRETG